MLCPDIDSQSELFQYIRQYVIDIPESEIQRIYSALQVNFEQVGAGDTVEAAVVHKLESISKHQNIPQGSVLHGIDLPTWFNDMSGDKKRIMILGIDPLRNESVFNFHNANRRTDVILGTPYGFHVPKMRSGRTRQFWELVKSLSQNNLVYLTDLYKVFFYTDDTKSERSYQYFRKNKSGNSDLLHAEINLIKPDLIVTLGAESYRHLLRGPGPDFSVTGHLKGIGNLNGTPVLPLMHLSGATRKANKENFLKANDIQGYGAEFGLAYAEIVKRILAAKLAA